MPDERIEKYFGMVSELTDINVNNFPTKFPMFFLGTSSDMEEYSRIMLKSISMGFDPKVRKLCFTLGCAEGYTHQDIFNLIKDVPEITEEKYTLLKNIVHWNPVQEATKVLTNYIKLVKVTQASSTAEIIKEHLEEAFREAKEDLDVQISTSK